MRPYAEVKYGNQIWRSKVAGREGLKPKWMNACNIFLIEKDATFEVVLFHKGRVYGNSEIGRATLSLSDVVQGHLTDWWTLMNNRDMAGSILLTFEFFEEGTRRKTDSSNMALFSTHSS